jgi:hypothetical protein
MAVPAIEDAPSYEFASRVDVSAGCALVQLAASSAPAAGDAFFDAELVRPAAFARLVLSVVDLSLKRYFMPSTMLERILAQADPVVTSSGGVLRFESLSACCGVYARADFLPAAFRGAPPGLGTTNVDVNAPLRAALAGLRGDAPVRLAVGRHELVMTTPQRRLAEPKVALPRRWIRGLAEAQAIQAGLEHRLEAPGVEAWRFLRSLPRSGSEKVAATVTRAASRLRWSQRADPGGVVVTGFDRLRLLEPLARDAIRLDVWSAPEGESAWQLSYPDSRMTLLLSAAPARGLSGEGRLLAGLAAPREESEGRVRAALRWQGHVDVDETARLAGIDRSTCLAALQALATQGLVGFDLAEGAYFHRELPFRHRRVEADQLRLKAARKLVASGALRVVAERGIPVVQVPGSGGVTHRVRLEQGGEHCTCAWHSKHGVARGPCKHILAARLAWADDD